MNETKSASERISTTVAAAAGTDEAAFQASLWALSTAVEAAAVRRTAENAAELSRVRERRF